MTGQYFTDIEGWAEHAITRGSGLKSINQRRRLLRKVIAMEADFRQMVVADLVDRF